MECGLYLPYGIREADVCKLVDWLESREAKDVNRVHLLLHSGGGPVGLAFAIATIIDHLPIEVWTYNVGNVDSAAAIVFAAGRRRICLMNGLFTLHPVGKQINGVMTAEELNRLATEIRLDEQRISDYMRRKLPHLSSDWHTLMMERKTLTATESVSIGLADCVGEVPSGIRVIIPTQT